MSDHETNDPRPADPVEPTSGSPEAGQGWRPPAAGPQPSDETTAPRPYEGATWPPQTYGQSTPMPGTAPTSGAEPTSGAAPTSGQPTSAAPMTSGGPVAGAPVTGNDEPASTSAAPSNPTAAPAGAWPAGGYQPGAYHPGGYQPGAYQPGSQPVGGYSTGQYQHGGYQPFGYQPGGEPSTGAGYFGGATAGYPTYQQNQANDGRRRGVGPKVGAVLLGVLLALGGGVAGAAWMHQLDGNNVTTTSAVGEGGAPDNAPIIDRSSLASIAAAVRPSVVSIATSNATGSGVIISADGYILTNNHVAATANGSNVQITLSDGSTVQGKLVGTDAKTDLAVYQAQNLSKQLTPAKFGNSGALRVGDTVLAIGSPLGLDGSVTSGIVSALNRTIDESSDQQPQNPFSPNNNQNSTPSATIAGAIQTDAAINPGNSGGALVNTNGEVVGINTAIATDGSDGNIGVGFAIPSNRAKTVAEDLIKGTPVQHPFLGIAVQTANGNAGAQVQQVTSGSPAAAAGLKTGDVVTAYNGQPVHTSDDLVNDVQAGNVNDQVTLTVQRGGSSMQIKVTLGESK